MLHKNKTAYLLISSLAMLALLLWLAWFTYGKIAAVNTLIKDAEAKIAVSESKEKEFSKIATEIKTSEGQINKINAVFLNDETFVNFVELLESLAREVGVKIKTEGASLQQGSVPASVQFNLEGNFGQIIRFLTLLDKIPVAGIVTNLEITAKDSHGDEKIAPGTLTAKAAYVIFNFKKP